MRKEGETCLVELKVQLLVFVREFREDVDLVLLLLVAVGERYRAVIHAACAVPVTQRSREKRASIPPATNPSPTLSLATSPKNTTLFIALLNVL